MPYQPFAEGSQSIAQPVQNIGALFHRVPFSEGFCLRYPHVLGMSTAAILLAAGRGSRLGGTTPKPLVSLGNQALLCKTLAHYLEASTIARVLLILGYESELIRKTLPEHERLTVLTNPAWPQGMSTSIRVGVEALGAEITTVLIGLGDMPWVSPELLDKIVQACESNQLIVAPFYQGERGHPVAFPACFMGALRELQGDRGAASLLKSQEIVALAVDEPGILTDIDTPEDLLKWTTKISEP